MKRVFKVHTENAYRLFECLKFAMYGVSNRAINNEMPSELLSISEGDIVFISEKELSNNALFGPFYVTKERDGIVHKKQKGCWIFINPECSIELADWVKSEKRYWCLLFDKTLIKRISIVWPNNWRNLNLSLPSWGLVTGPDSLKLIDFAVQNRHEQKTREFLGRHVIW